MQKQKKKRKKKKMKNQNVCQSQGIKKAFDKH